MISLYILLIASVVAIFGLFVTIFARVKKIDRSKRMGHFFLTFGIIVALFAGFSINKEKEAHQAARDYQKKVQTKQIYDAELVHLSDKKVKIKDGETKVTIHVSKNTAVKVSSNHEQLHDLNYKPNKSKKDIKVTFVMPGKYTVKATRGQNKITKHITVQKDDQKNVGESTSTSANEAEIVEPASEEVVEEPAVTEETSTEKAIDPGLTEDSAETDTAATDVAPSYDETPSYTPTWTPNTGGAATDTGAADTGTQSSEASDDAAGTEDSVVDDGSAVQ